MSARRALSRGIAVLALALLAGCAGRDDSRPRNVENACAMFADRPHWRAAIRDSERKWGAPAEVQLAIIWRESSFQGDARPPRGQVLGFIPTARASSARGFPQAIDGTWDWYRRETGNRGARRDVFRDSADFVGWYMAKTQSSNRVPMSDAFRHYLNYHEGHAGYRSGRWRGNANVQRAASQVEGKAAEYRVQLARCG